MMFIALLVFNYLTGITGVIKIIADAIVGAPVGFVGASDSKYQLEQTDIPHIVVQGRKGGSNIAAAIINAILYAM